MATVYSLICWGGRTGKAVTISIATPAVVTLSNHGLRDGTGVVFSTTGALPTGITAGVTYYSRSTASGTFNLYDTSAHAIAGGTTGRVATSGTQSGTHTIKGGYFTGLTNLSRWGASGSERIYDSLVSWKAARSGANAFDEEICEIGEAFDDIFTADLTLNVPCAVCRITPTVNGVYTSAWHGGVFGAGYRLVKNYGYGGGLGFASARVTVEDITVHCINYWGNIVTCRSVYGTFQRNFVSASSTSIDGLVVGGSAGKVLNNVIVGVGIGIKIMGYEHQGGMLANNTVVACITGIKAENTYCYGWAYNNVSVGCSSENWNGTVAYMSGAAYNAGAATGGTPFGTNAITTATADNTTFLDYAGRDLRPAAGSVLIDTGAPVFGIDSVDVKKSERPNYNNGGAEHWDIGAFEYDHGYVRPASHTLTLTNVVVGSRILIRDQADTVTHYSADAAESTVVITVTVYSDSRDNWRIRVRKATTSVFYQPYETLMTATAGSSSIYVSQIPDE